MGWGCIFICSFYIFILGDEKGGVQMHKMQNISRKKYVERCTCICLKLLHLIMYIPFTLFFNFCMMFSRIPKRIADYPREKSKLEMEVVPGSINDGYNRDLPK